MYKLLLTARFERKLKKISKMSKKEAEKIRQTKGLTDFDAEKLSHTHLRTTYKNQFE